MDGRSSDEPDSRLCGRERGIAGIAASSSGWGGGSSGTSSEAGAKAVVRRRMSVSLAMLPRRRRKGMMADGHGLPPLEAPGAAVRECDQGSVQGSKVVGRASS